MKKYDSIIINYFHFRQLPNLEYKHGESFEYSIEKQNEIITNVLDNNYSVKINVISNNLCISIDTQNGFKQR